MDDNILYNQGNERERKMFTSKEIVQLIHLIMMRKDAINKLSDNPYVTPEYRAIMENEIKMMESILNKLHPNNMGA